MTKHIEIDELVHNKLKKIGHKGETYSDIIKRILNDTKKY